MGQDSGGNKYYRQKGPASLKERRWVIYKGIPEASKVPPEWHGWLHHTCEKPLCSGSLKRWPWEKNHLPNLTGTPYAYVPTEQNDKARNYKAWTPSKGKK